MHAGERHAQSGILHADLKAQTLALRKIHSEDLAGSKTQGHPEGILQRHHKKCCHAGSQDLTASGGHHCRDNHHNRADRHNREHRSHAFNLSAEDFVHDHAGGDRNKDHLNDRHKHRRRIDREPLTRKGIHQSRGHNRRKQRRAGGHRHRERHVAAGKEGNDIRRRPAGNAAQEHQTDSEVRRQIKRLAEHKSRERHDQELSEDPDRHILGTTEDFTKVRCRQREPHAEHNYAEKNRDIRTYRFEDLGENEAEGAEYDDPKGKRFVHEAADHQEGVHHVSHSGTLLACRSSGCCAVAKPGFHFGSSALFQTQASIDEVDWDPTASETKALFLLSVFAKFTAEQ